MVFQNKRYRLVLFAFALVVSTSGILTVGVISWQSLNASTVENEGEGYSHLPNGTRMRCRCKATLCNMDKYRAGLLDDCLRESIDRHLADCPYCASVYRDCQ